MLPFLPAAVRADTAPTLEQLARRPEVDSMKLSPNGRFLGYLSSDAKENRSLMIFDIGKKSFSGVRGEKGMDVASFQWVSDDQLIFNVTRDKIYAFGLYAVNRERLSRQFCFNRYDVTTIVGVPRKRPNRALVWIRRSSHDVSSNGSLVEMRTDRDMDKDGDTIVRRYDPPEHGAAFLWRAGPDGELALCYTYGQHETRLHRYDQERRVWRRVPLNPVTHTVAAIDPDNRHLWISHFKEGAGFVLQRYDPDTNTFAAPVWTEPRYDLGTGRLRFSRKTGALAGLTYQQQRPVSVWFDSAYREAIDRISSAGLPCRGNRPARRHE